MRHAGVSGTRVGDPLRGHGSAGPKQSPGEGARRRPRSTSAGGGTQPKRPYFPTPPPPGAGLHSGRGERPERGEGRWPRVAEQPGQPVIEWRGGWPFCRACNCWSGPGHEASPQHRNRAGWPSRPPPGAPREVSEAGGARAREGGPSAALPKPPPVRARAGGGAAHKALLPRTPPGDPAPPVAAPGRIPRTPPDTSQRPTYEAHAKARGRARARWVPRGAPVEGEPEGEPQRGQTPEGAPARRPVRAGAGARNALAPVPEAEGSSAGRAGDAPEGDDSEDSEGTEALQDGDEPPDSRHDWKWDAGRQKHYYVKRRWNRGKQRWKHYRKYARGRPDPSIRPPVLGGGEKTESPWALAPLRGPPCCDSCGEDLTRVACVCASRVSAREKAGSLSVVTGSAVRGRGEVGYLRKGHPVRGFYFDEAVDRGAAPPESPDEGRAPCAGDPGKRRWSASWRTPLAADAPARVAGGKLHNPRDVAQSLAPFWPDATTYLMELFSHQRPRGGPSQAGRDRDCWEPGARDRKRGVYTPFHEKAARVQGTNISMIKDLAVSLNTLGPNQMLSLGMGVGGATPSAPRTGVPGLDLEAVPADRRECLVTVYRGLAPSHLVAAVEGMDRGSLVPGVGGSRVGVRVHCNKEGAAAQPAHLSDGQGGRLGELFCHDGILPCGAFSRGGHSWVLGRQPGCGRPPLGGWKKGRAVGRRRTNSPSLPSTFAGSAHISTTASHRAGPTGPGPSLPPEKVGTRPTGRSRRRTDGIWRSGIAGWPADGSGTARVTSACALGNRRLSRPPGPGGPRLG